jgi:hypothetical protein
MAMDTSRLATMTKIRTMDFPFILKKTVLIDDGLMMMIDGFVESK